MWSPSKYIAKQNPVVVKFTQQLEKKGISFSPTDGEQENVVFTYKDKTLKMSKHSFYRYSGISTVYNFKADNSLEIIEVTDEMYLNTFIKPIIELQLGL